MPPFKELDHVGVPDRELVGDALFIQKDIPDVWHSIFIFYVLAVLHEPFVRHHRMFAVMNQNET